MSNMQMREKLRKITEAASDSDQVSEQSKNIGMIVFFILAGFGLLALVIFSFTLFIYGRYISALIASVATIFISYLLYKIQTADEIPKN